jgi:Immunity protein 35
MLSFQYCRYRAELRLAQLAQECGDELALLPEPHETERTLAFFYQTADYLRTGDATQALAGNGPILVSKLTGTVEIAGTALPVEASIRDFETDAAKSA